MILGRNSNRVFGVLVGDRNGVNSIPELELMVNSEIGIDYFKNGIGIDKFWIGIEVCYKKLIPQINLPFNSEIFLIWQSYLEYKLLSVGIPSMYSEYLLMVKSSR